MKKLRLAALCTLLFLAAGCQEVILDRVEPIAPRIRETRADYINLRLIYICDRQNSPTLSDDEYSSVLELVTELMNHYPGFRHIIEAIERSGRNISFALNPNLSDPAQYDCRNNTISFSSLNANTIRDFILMEEFIHAAQATYINIQTWIRSRKNIEFEARAIMDCITSRYTTGIYSEHGGLGFPETLKHEYQSFIKLTCGTSMIYFDQFELMSLYWNDSRYAHYPYAHDYNPELFALVACFP